MGLTFLGHASGLRFHRLLIPVGGIKVVPRANRTAINPGDRLPADPAVTDETDPIAATLQGLGYKPAGQAMWMDGGFFTVGRFEFWWDGRDWAAGRSAFFSPHKDHVRPGDAFPADPGVAAQDDANAKLLDGLGYKPDPTAAWFELDNFTIGAFEFYWDNEWKPGAKSPGGPDKLAVNPGDAFAADPKVTSASSWDADHLDEWGYHPASHAAWGAGESFTIGGLPFHWNGNEWGFGAQPAAHDKAAVKPGDQFDDAADINWIQTRRVDPNTGAIVPSEVHGLAARGYVPADSNPWPPGSSFDLGIHLIHWTGSYWEPGSAP